ncbi:carboxypeptidase-like regulatory domain-containing protein [uncultured Dokdonia sp.]|uniref:carboxypeptidase-like regulatory domain-containing protein n=1 Tax=uncultured Dokdonia sp. TaxID=575653 RepID=UPI00260B9DC7|nr:carboxypeptidase-like regulatory domain-containing protein [uncultured Dokdonia sp.]
MRRLIFTLLLVSVISTVIAQEDTTPSQKNDSVPALQEGYINGAVLSSSTDQALQNVNIVNLTNLKGAITDTDGAFEIKAQVDDTLFFSYLGYKTLQVRVSADWVKYGNVKIKMTEVGIALEEVLVQQIQLTGYLEIDAKRIPIYNNSRFSISGLNTGYEGGASQPGAVSRVINAIFNPADLLYNIFGKKPEQLKKMRKMKEDDTVRNLLEKKFDRETLVALLQIDKNDIDAILNNCNYSDNFIVTANDLQILDAISECYEEYRVLQKRN